jgi:hypothetical protein
LSGNRAATPSCRTAPWQGWRVNPSPAAKQRQIRTLPLTDHLLRGDQQSSSSESPSRCSYIVGLHEKMTAKLLWCGSSSVRKSQATLAHPKSETGNRRSSSKCSQWRRRRASAWRALSSQLREVIHWSGPVTVQEWRIESGIRLPTVIRKFNPRA